MTLWTFQCLLTRFASHTAAAETAPNDFSALSSLKDTWKNTPPDWEGSDPCGDGWDGIKCTKSRVTSITLSGVGLTGQLTGDIGSLTELNILDLSYNKGLTGPLPASIGSLKMLNTLILVGCDFTGSIPDEIGNLRQLVYLSLNSNRFSGPIPRSIGNLSKLYWLDLADNQLDGIIPVSSGTNPGLDMLNHTKHFHFGKNKLTGNIPPELFSSDMALIHVLFESNQLSGSIPSTLGNVTTLEVVRLDNNSLTGRVPENLNNLNHVRELFLSNNKLSGPLPDLSKMNSLNYLDMSNNGFEQSDFPLWLTTLQSLTTIMMENTQLQGEVPSSLFSLANLQTVVLKNNELNGTLDVRTSKGGKLRRIDLQNNHISELKPQDEPSGVTIILVKNLICEDTEAADAAYCKIPQPNVSNPILQNNCQPISCNKPDQVSSPNCVCAYPYTGAFSFRAPSFSDLGNGTYFLILRDSLMKSFAAQLLPVDSVSLSNPTRDSYHYLILNLSVFPSSQEQFNRTGISSIGFLLSNQTFKPPKEFGPFVFKGDPYRYFEDNSESSKSLNMGIIIGAVVGGSVLLVLLVLAGVYAFCQKRRADRAIGQSNPFGRWDTKESNSGIPQLKATKKFSFQELQKCTKNFSRENDIGTGGYGKVYLGTLPSGQRIAIKRAQKESKQGQLEFKAEIELLSRVHHKNLVSLVGFCFEREEQMLVYEYVPKGSLKDAISGKSGIRLDWIRRLKVALGAARGLAYLHELADPPIIHRDIKSNNILLDERLNAKVSDFGLSKPMLDSEKDHITTQVKGTMGYLDPEYYMSQQLTEKSDVYSFGVLMLELITARKPIERGKYIVKLVRNAIDKSKELYGLHELVDSAIGLGSTLMGFEKFVDLAMSCLQEAGPDRPKMSDAVKEIESILLLAGSNPNAESASTSASFEELSKGSSHHPYGNDSFDCSTSTSKN
ncbi:hypothetical protein L6164_036107 [Bauhinia variegata]|uniref:Uncharacterized protein n=1 Tax=Bauhinia variegata TaxID=167791 RepID=A0ACB9KFZ9_BAUVA|nr:hypothetical protein L6164_036107 [Bauhinia variegata]